MRSFVIVAAITALSGITAAITVITLAPQPLSGRMHYVARFPRFPLKT
jgi:hypothetical protein